MVETTKITHTLCPVRGEGAWTIYNWLGCVSRGSALPVRGFVVSAEIIL